MKPIKGMYLDCAPVDQPSGTYRRALNIVLNKLNQAVAVEPGTSSTPSFSVSSGYIPIAYTMIDADNTAVLAAIPGSVVGEIGIFNEAAGTYTVKFAAANLGLSMDYPVKMISYKNHKNERIIVFTDDYNSPRIFNLDVDPQPYTVAQFNANTSLMNLFPDALVPGVDIEVLDGGGSLLTGVHYVAIAYELEDGYVTDYFCISNPINISKGAAIGYEAGINSSKGIRVSLTSVDTSFHKLRVTLVSCINETYTAVETEGIPITGTTQEITISSLEGTSDILLEDVTINRAHYTKAKTLTYEARKLYMGNVATTEFPDYQQYANEISIEWDASKKVKLYEVNSLFNLDSLTGVTASFKNGNTNFHYRGFMPGEVYAFYISWILKDGSHSPAFHIPGRAVIALDTDYYENDRIVEAETAGKNGYIAGDTIMDQAIDTDAKFFQMRDTTPTTLNTYGTMGYWENEELYPSDFPAGYKGTALAGSPVRHHRFPTLNRLKQLGIDPYSTVLGTQVTAVTLGIRVQHVPLPTSIADMVQGFEIYYAKRDFSNSLILAHSYLFNDPQVNYEYDAEDFEEGATHPDPSDYITKNTDPYAYIDTAYRFHSPDLLKNAEYPSISPNFLMLDLEMGCTPATGEISNQRYKTRMFGINIVTDPGDGSFNAITSSDVRVLNTPRRCVMAIKDDSVKYDPFTPDDYRETALTGTVPATFVWTYTKNALSSVFPVFLCSYNVNCYFGFDGQKMVSTGTPFLTSLVTDQAVETGVLNLYSAAHSPVIYGGDTSVHNYSFFTQYMDSSGRVRQKILWVLPHYTYCNIGLRHEGSDYGQKVFPFSAHIKYEQDSDISPIIRSYYTIDYGSEPEDIDNPEFTVDNYIQVSNDYAKVNDLDAVYPKKRNYEEINEFPTRIISSQPVSNEDVSGSIRKFLPLDYYEMPKNKGEITNLEGYSGMLLIQTEDSLFKTTGKIALKADTSDVTIGSGDIFTVEPTEILPVPGGYAGCKHPYATKLSKAGYLFIDSSAKKIFLLREELAEISNEGLRNEIETNLPFKIVEELKALTHTDDIDLFNDNPFSPYGVGYAVTYDEKYLRLIISKRDYKFRTGQFANFNALYQMLDGSICDLATSTKQPLASLSTYIEDNSFTLSYDIAGKQWSCFHSYHPAFLMNTKKNFYGANLSSRNVYQHNVDYRNGYYYDNALAPSWIDITLPDRNASYSTTASISWTGRYIDTSGNPDFYKTFDKILVYNTHQVSGWRNIYPTDTYSIPGLPSSITTIKYGALYNWYAATDAREICAEGWHIATQAEWDILITYLGGDTISGGKLKETGFTYWESPNTGATNAVGFNIRGAGERRDYGVFLNIKQQTELWTSDSFDATFAYTGYISYDAESFDVYSLGWKFHGKSLRPMRSATEAEQLLADRTACDNYIGNDGKIYGSVKIGTQIWVSEYLAETMYRNGDPIPVVTDNSAWAALTTGGMCYYNNDVTNSHTTVTTPGVPSTLLTARNTRFVKGRWRFNDFRDMTSITGTTPPINDPVQENFDLLVDSAGEPVNIDNAKLWHKQKRFIDTYTIIRLKNSNTDPCILYLYDLETTGREIPH